MNTTIKQIDLYMTEGSSDKHYQVRLTQNAKGFLVEYANGRRGSPLRHGLKTPSEVTEDVALKEFDKVVKSKKKGGYTEDLSGQAYLNTGLQGCVVPFKPHLLTQVSDDSLFDALRGSVRQWGIQIKHDGERRYLSHDRESHVIAGNRKGFSVPISEPVHAELSRIATYCDFQLEIVCEDMNDHVYAFDLLSIGGKNCKNIPFVMRYELLKNLLDKAGCTDESVIRLSHLFMPSSDEDVYNHVDDLREQNEEGAVFKLLSSEYVDSARNQDQLKLKFWETATVRVKAPHATKRSVAMEMQDENGTWHEVGNCTIPANASHFPEAGELFDVRYLYAFAGGSLFQPIFDRFRTDLTDEACRLAALKLKKIPTAA